MAISYQRRTRGKGTGQTVRITATVRRDDTIISSTFTRMDLARSWAVKVQDAIISAKERGFEFDREKWIRRGRAKTLKEIIGDIDRLAIEREPDLDPIPWPEWSMKRAFEWYLATVTPTKKGADRETSRVNIWIRHKLASSRLKDITPSDIQSHVNARLVAGRAAMTVRNETFLLSALYRHAAKLPPPPPNNGPSSGWGLTELANPVATVELPEPPPHRKRRLQGPSSPGQQGEEERMKGALAAGLDGELMVAMFVLAVETGMRLSEVLSIRPVQILSADGARYISQPDSKNGDPRFVVLSSRAGVMIDKLLPAALKNATPLIPLTVHTV